MISLKINDINNFMQKLLIGNAFDSFLLCEGEVDTSNTFAINGRINQKFYNADELEAIPDEFVYWRDIKHILRIDKRTQSSQQDETCFCSYPKLNILIF